MNNYPVKGEVNTRVGFVLLLAMATVCLILFVHLMKKSPTPASKVQPQVEVNPAPVAPADSNTSAPAVQEKKDDAVFHDKGGTFTFAPASQQPPVVVPESELRR